jgi:hypothetical protein
MADKKQSQSIGQAVFEIYECEKQVAALLIKIDERKQIVQQYFDNNGIKKLEVESNSKIGSLKLVAKRSERVTIKYDIDKLKKRLDPEIFLEISKRSYIITNIDAMIKLMKDNGISAKDFKALIEADIKVDNQAIKRLYDAHEINMADIKGCYDATINKFIKVEEGQGDSD